MGGPGSGRKKGSGGKSAAMKSAISSRNYAKAGGMTTSGKSAALRLKKSRGKIAYLKKTGQ